MSVPTSTKIVQPDRRKGTKSHSVAPARGPTRNAGQLMISPEPMRAFLGRLEEPADSAASPPDVAARMNRVMGCRTDEFALPVLEQIVRLEHPDVPSLTEHDVDVLLRRACAMVAELQPTNAIQTLLAAQMVATQRTAMHYLASATMEGQTVEGADRHVLRAVRLMARFNEQAELLAKLQGRMGQQRVVVEYVNVAAGGQALVGTFASRTGQSGGGALCPKPSINPIPSGAAG